MHPAFIVELVQSVHKQSHYIAQKEIDVECMTIVGFVKIGKLLILLNPEPKHNGCRKLHKSEDLLLDWVW